MTSLHYESPLTVAIEGLIRQKQAMGYRYEGESRMLYRFDQFVLSQGVEETQLDSQWRQGML